MNINKFLFWSVIIFIIFLSFEICLYVIIPKSNYNCNVDGRSKTRIESFKDSAINFTKFFKSNGILNLTKEMYNNFKNISIPKVSKFKTLPKPNSKLNIFALPVGNGDCTIIQCPSGDLIIIDAGNSGGEGWMEAMIATFLKSQLGRITTLIVMHSDMDHFSYIPELFTLNVVPGLERIILGGKKDDYTSPVFRKWLNQHAEVLEYVNDGEPCIGQCNTDPPQCNNGNDGVQFRYLGANLGNSVDGRSLIMQVVVSDTFQLLMPGDFLGADIEELLVDEWERRGNPIKSSHLKVSHHGNSKKANSKAFLNAIAPKFAFTSASYPGPPFWYPSCESIKTLLNVGSIELRRKPGRFSCGDEADRKAIQYENWPYAIYTLSPNVGDYEMVSITVPIPSN